jgi:hypothetical protein
VREFILEQPHGRADYLLFVDRQASDWLRGSRAFVRAERWVSGTVLVALGVTAALSGPRQR